MKLVEAFTVRCRRLFEAGYSYEDAVELDDLTPQEVRQELKKHDASWEDFLRDVGNKPKYTGQEVLDWLGY